MDHPIKVEVQWFDGCPNSESMLTRVQTALNELDIPTDFVSTRVDSIEQAKEVRFLGSPTLLLNGREFMGQQLPDEPFFACRYYPDGLPTVEEIVDRLQSVAASDQE